MMVSNEFIFLRTETLFEGKPYAFTGTKRINVLGPPSANA